MVTKHVLRYGPYRLTELVIDREVPHDRGCYALGPKSGNGGIHVLRVGRSDLDVNSRLKWYVGREGYEDCTHFFIDLYETKAVNFRTECLLFRDYEPALNDRFPGPPRGR